jgi:hypothetical protein
MEILSFDMNTGKILYTLTHSVPGNHDYGNGVLGDKIFVDLLKKKYFKSGEYFYPRLDIIDNIAFIGLDSTADPRMDYDGNFI